ncbi:MAG: hypothetical protein RJQ00_06055 [Vicingaceae bacterium]
MLENYSDMIENLIESFIKVQATELEVKEEDIRLVLKTRDKALVALLYHQGKFVRKVEIKEILELIN